MSSGARDIEARLVTDFGALDRLAPSPSTKVTVEFVRKDPHIKAAVLSRELDTRNAAAGKYTAFQISKFLAGLWPYDKASCLWFYERLNGAQLAPAMVKLVLTPGRLDVKLASLFEGEDLRKTEKDIQRRKDLFKNVDRET